MMLGKLNYELGILPELKNCLYCHKDLDSFDLMKFEPQSGGFSCSECLLQGEQSISSDRNLFEDLKASHDLRKLMKLSLSLKSSEVLNMREVNRRNCEALFNYFCYQFNYQKSDFKSWSLLVAL